MRSFFAIICLLSFSRLAAQKVVHFDTLSGSNDFVYPQAAVDSLLQLSNYTAVIYAEYHTEHFEPAFKFHFLKHLNEAYGYRDVFTEAGKAAAWLYNRYLETGDTSYFRPLGPEQKFTACYMWPGYRTSFWPQLYDYNKRRPPSQRFVFHGTDFERKDMLGVLVLLIPAGRNIPPKLAPVFADIHAYIADTGWQDFTKEAAEKYAHIRSGFRQAGAAVKDLYGKNYAVAESIIRNDAKQQTNWRPRNKTMFAEIEQAVKDNGLKKMVGFFGGMHTTYEHPSSIPKKMDGLAPFHDHTLHLTSLYYNRTSLYSGTDMDKAKAVYDSFLTKAYRATLMSTATTGEHWLMKRADFVLLVNDRAAP